MGAVKIVPSALHTLRATPTTMYYRAQVDGALFSIGDPHISQGALARGARVEIDFIARRPTPAQRA